LRGEDNARCGDTSTIAINQKKNWAAEKEKGMGPFETTQVEDDGLGV
jgi:hypothetical protein